jgi:hypothetical protein
VGELDRVLETAIRQQMTDQGMELLRWMSSHLNEVGNNKGLVTAYLIKDRNEERQMIALRMTIASQKMILMGCFDGNYSPPPPEAEPARVPYS